MRHFAVAAIGRDRPGIVATVTRSLLEQQLNVEDSQMTILRGHFTMMLIIAGDDQLDVPQLRGSLERTARELGLEAISLSEVTDVEAGPATEPTHIVTVYGADHPGIVAGISAVLSAQGVNITDLETRLAGSEEAPVYAMLMEVALGDSPVERVQAALDEAAGQAEVEISLRELDSEAL